MNSLLQAIVNTAALLPFATALAVIVAFLAGIWMVSRGIIAMAKPRNSNSMDVGYVATQIAVGSILISLGAIAVQLTSTIFDSTSISTSEEIFAYAPGTIGIVDDPTTRTIIRSIVGIIQFIGLLGIIRGLFMFSAYSKQDVKTIGPAITFTVAGALALNFPRVIGAFSLLFT